ncbi:flavodoxin family protein [Anaeroselena agilis]|uniref:Flavodoxin family protein n=1 Tax=Anaeroselena agilis TaxID=3063788 RepID=A0ABU3P006_9FIRM|nr:flavodoxin family protein [Selenomonadales bacterium 4137-cl]
MKIVAVNGSHKGRAGNTAVMVDAFLKGARLAGAETAHIALAEKEIGYCRACKACWFATPGQCVLRDDMAEIAPLLKSAAVWVWATPLYFDNLSSRLKAFLDRLMVLASPRWTKDDHGECRHLTAGPPPKLALIANCGYPERSHFQVISHWLERHARNLGAEVVGEIYASEGALLTSPADELRPVVADRLQVIETAGREIAAGLAISAETRELLARPFIPAEAYIRGVESHIAALLEKAP